MLQELSDESRKCFMKMNIAKARVMVVDNNSLNANNNSLNANNKQLTQREQQRNQREQCADRKCRRLHMHGATLQHQGK